MRCGGKGQELVPIGPLCWETGLGPDEQGPCVTSGEAVSHSGCTASSLEPDDLV